MADVVVDTANKNPKELLGQGIRAYILQDYSSAVTALSKASELLVLQHGDDLHDALGDVYLYYGKALLGLSREETDALGDAIPKNEESDDEETETMETDANCGAEKIEEKDKSTEIVKENDTGEGSSNSAMNPPVGESVEQENNDDEPTDLQVAWEVLELAKKIFEKHGEEGKKNLAETLTVLGEISLESENFVAAINDIKEGLKIQKELFGQDSRTVAETYYKLGVAYSTNSQIDNAIDSFEASLEYLQNRVNYLEKLEERKDEIEEEVNEVKSLIPDIEEKINDMKTYKDEVCQCDVRTTIREFVGKPKFDKVNLSSINLLQVKRKPTIEAALEKVRI